MPAHRKSLKELELNGSLQHDRKRYRNRINPPQPTGDLGSPPRHLSKEVAAVWRELVRIAPPRVLGNSDGPILELASMLLAKVRKFGIGGKKGATGREVALLSNFLGRIGFSPVDRGKVMQLPERKVDENNRFAEFARGAKENPYVEFDRERKKFSN